jgi:hypothetical protein
MAGGEQSAQATPEPLTLNPNPNPKLPRVGEEEAWVKMEVKKNSCEEEL